jgi:hypothetical protein
MSSHNFHQSLKRFSVASALTIETEFYVYHKFLTKELSSMFINNLNLDMKKKKKK